MVSRGRTYCAIDLKSFYSSVECVARGLDPLTTNLVVADVSRTEKTICLAVSPPLKAYGLGGRPRLFEVVQRVREVNYDRRLKAPGNVMTGKSTDDTALREHPDWEVDYIAATPRMAEYIKVSSQIYGVYLKYIAPEDIHVYSIDEVFFDATDYLKAYRLTAHELCMKMIQDVLRTTGITATAGIGTNLYLCKVAMDIVAKHIPADKDGVRIAELDERSYRETLWDHRPLTDFWRVGRGISQRLAAYGIDTMGKLARLSVQNENFLYKLFGINAELLIDHAWGWEPVTMAQVKSYRPQATSTSSGQVLQEPYSFEKGSVVIREMADALSLDLVERRVVTGLIVIDVGYDRESLNGNTDYQGEVRHDHYGRAVPKHAHGTVRLPRLTASTKVIVDAVAEVFHEVVNPHLLIRRLTITACNLITEEKARELERLPVQLDLFTDYQEIEAQRQLEAAALAKERKLQEATLRIKKKFGKNALLKGLNFADGATQIERHKQIGGHRA